MLTRAIAIGIAATLGGGHAAFFSDGDRSAVLGYWSAPGRYQQEPTDRPGFTWKVRLTPEGSKWLWDYDRARGLSKTNPLVDPEPMTAREAEWEAWIEGAMAWDRWQASMRASELNAQDVGVRPDAPDGVPAPDPGPMPDDLKALVGEMPATAAAVRPLRHSVAFDDGLSLSYVDQVPVRPRYRYFRFGAGVTTQGQAVGKMPAAERARLMAAAGLNAGEQRVMMAVSPLEGGFDSVNTYDTGLVSVGFIQFAALQAGAGSLGEVLLGEKRDAPEAFAADFHRFGIDVDDRGALVALDLATGREFSGQEAARAIIEDKRLTAVFQRAGRVSNAFRVAQLRAARRMYYPADDLVPVRTGDATIKLRVGDVVRSEAGMATLMDRKVNTGNLNPLPDLLSGLARDLGITNADEFAAHEMEIIEAMSFRRDFLAEASLTQPNGPRAYSKSSRHGARPRPADPGSDGRPSG
ncbi:MAG: hypothetical protein HYR64_08475 [Fimbriimonas ginsengisoli]|uniref:Uncharacterized protein n=1 Tax=Fimbriimonas ginsengisoli TaxID=1005039 RepID=A0A931PU77_FIMGI|nr:hypothetical protein [Fimbriimonas ginsengisoli]